MQLQVDSTASTCVELLYEFKSLLQVNDPLTFLNSLRPTMRKATLEDLDDFLSLAESRRRERPRQPMAVFAEAMHEWICVDLAGFLLQAPCAPLGKASGQQEPVLRAELDALERIALRARWCLLKAYARYSNLVDGGNIHDLVRMNNGGPEIATLKEVLSTLRGGGANSGGTCLRAFRESYVASAVGDCPLGSDQRVRALLVMGHGLSASSHDRCGPTLRAAGSDAKMICRLLGWERTLQTLRGKLKSSPRDAWLYCGKIYVRACCFVADSTKVENQRKRVDCAGHTTSLPFPFLEAAFRCFNEHAGRAAACYPSGPRWRACRQGDKANHRIACIRLAKDLEFGRCGTAGGCATGACAELQ